MSTSSSSRAHIPALDGLRGLAILLVLTSHLYLPQSMKLRVLAHAGWIGVDLFFVLSGYLITGILLSAKHRPGYFREFYTRRARRIFPIYYLALVLGVFLLPVTPAIARLRDLQWWFWGYAANIAQGVYGGDAMPVNWALFWSLAVEEQFYLVWPLVVLTCRPGTLQRVCVAAIAAAWILRPLLFAAGYPGDFAYVQLVTRMDALCAGAWVAAWVADGRTVRPSIAATVGSLALLGAVGVGVWRGAFLSSDPRVLTYALPLVTLGGGAVLVLGITGRARLLESPLLRFWAPYSYGLYVWHRVVTDLIAWPTATSHLGTLLLFLAKVSVSLLAAMASWHLFEQWWLQAPTRAVVETESVG